MISFSGMEGQLGGTVNVNVRCVNTAFVCLQALLELEMNSDLKAQLRELNITAAKVRVLT